MPDDVLISLPTTVKARTEEIVIRNQNPDQKRLDVYQSLRPMRDGMMGEPIKHFMRSTPVDADLLAVEIDGITGLQVMTWLSKWAAAINATDGTAAAAQMGAE
jgi:hypothetical protein